MRIFERLYVCDPVIASGVQLLIVEFAAHGICESLDAEDGS